MTEEAKRKLMRLTRSQLNPIGQLVYDFCKVNHKSPSKVECSLNNGVLVIDGNNVERVAPLVRPFMVENPEADYYENRILARAGL